MVFISKALLILAQHSGEILVRIGIQPFYRLQIAHGRGKIGLRLRIALQKELR